MISKELLSEVLNQNVTSVYKQQEQYRYTTSSVNGPWTSGSDVPLPNIYELAHRCKEWALSVYHNIDFMVYGRSQCDLTIFTQPDDIKYNFNADTEPEAIFKACEWILKDKR